MTVEPKVVLRIQFLVRVVRKEFATTVPNLEFH